MKRKHWCRTQYCTVCT